MGKIPDIKDFAFRDTSFANLMQKRIYNVLLLATKYDAFMLEDDGRVDEQMFNEYTSLSLSSPPRFTQVTTEEEALRTLEDRNFELIICMPNMDNRDIFQAASEIKSKYPNIPIAVLTPFSKEVTARVAKEDLSAIDYVFSWLGNSELLLAIIKLIEDKMNAPFDTTSAGVQIILLVEDSIRSYSSTLPLLYHFVLEQSMEFSKEALNGHLKMLRLRGRPKICLARNYEEAENIYTQYKDNILGVISDMSFMHSGIKDALAGYEFGRMLQQSGQIIPFILESSDDANRQYAEKLKCPFVNKYSKTYPQQLRKEVNEHFGFGDFVILNPQTHEEIMRIHDLKDLQQKIFSIPSDSLAYHLSRNHFSRFFYSRAMFPPAELLKKVNVSDYEDMNEARKLIFNCIVEYRRIKNSGVIAIYQKDRFDEYSTFARIGNGSLGGKGRGLAFIGSMLNRVHGHTYSNLKITIPRTVVICTDIFDEFMERNNLYPFALSDASDSEILNRFLEARLPDKLLDDLRAFIRVVRTPIAVRSSSLLEDSHYQPFAGIYSTYMMPRTDDNEDYTLDYLRKAIKAVYASVFYRDSKAYMTATSNLIDQEKMAVVLQEMAGTAYGDRFYPIISGVARSINSYPVNQEKPSEGIANVAFGLGKYIVDGGLTLRFSPAHPHHILQLSQLDIALRETQTKFYSLNLKDKGITLSTDDAFNLLKLNVKEAVQDNSLKYVASTYEAYDGVLVPGVYPEGRKVITFSGILENEVFPVADVLQRLLDMGQREMGRPIEIEFAVNPDPHDDTKAIFYYLQIRPIVDAKQNLEEDLQKVSRNDLLMYCDNALGQGITDDVYDIVCVKTENFNAQDNGLIAREVEKINATYLSKGEGYILIGPGRWGSSDPWLGIPVKWPHISGARLIVEKGLKNYMIEPSQGTHFFQNITSLGVGFFTINPNSQDSFIDEEFLKSSAPQFETEHVACYHFDSPLVVKIDGRRSIGLVVKPHTGTTRVPNN